MSKACAVTTLSSSLCVDRVVGTKPTNVNVVRYIAMASGSAIDVVRSTTAW